jgi:hypothetical protein
LIEGVRDYLIVSYLPVRDCVIVNTLLGDALEAAGTDLSEFDDLKPFEVAVCSPTETRPNR